MPGIKLQLWYTQQNWIVFFLTYFRSSPLCPLKVTVNISSYLLLDITCFDKTFNIGFVCGALMCFICGLRYIYKHTHPDNSYALHMQY